jgi:guanylate kinase
VVGGLNIKHYFGEQALAIFVKPPSIDALEKRLRYRSTETEETLTMRVSKAVRELSFENKFEKVIMNDDLNKALTEAEYLVQTFINS